jgi:class 3 adenylate cyclase/tetratricopeptide (TPR) repeat protein
LIDVTCTACGYRSETPFKFCPECGTPADAQAPTREQRKVVTVLFCDITGSTALGERLDPEPLRALLARYFERMRGIVEAHGGTVEKFIGDAVMAVFGVPVLHEDDALRAVRAAVEMRDALPELGVHGRIGVMTGEVVTGTEERLATGDAVNVAARLEQAAEPGEVLIGAETLRLVRSSVEVEEVEPLALKGKGEPVAAYRLLSVSRDVTRIFGTPMVGRERQQRMLADAFAAAVADRACHLVTVLGPAGVGKSRLVAEFLAGLDARVVRGRCLSYGEGITYWPVVEVLKQLDVEPSDGPLASLLGTSEAVTTADDIAWTFGKALEEAAAERPLVCVLDDLHWAEPTLLELVESVADWSRGAPILLLCIARPDLLDKRQGWAGGKLNATTLLLEALSTAETEQLIEALLEGAPIDAALRTRIAEAAEGNPLFVEEMLALVRESGGSEVVVPPSIQALLAARLDQLDPAERSVLERGAVEGKIFHRSVVEALAPEELQVRSRLMALVRRELVRPDRAILVGDDAYRFRHLLIRDAAYDGLPKSTRADLHEQFAGWLAEHGLDLVELDEIVGYHLEQACRYRRELGEAVDPKLAAAARERLVAAAGRATLRQDDHATVNLLRRAEAADQAPLDLADQLNLLDALFFSGSMREADELAGARAAASDDPIARRCLLLLQMTYRLYLEPEGVSDQMAGLVEESRPIFQEAGDDVALHVMYIAASQVSWTRAAMAEAFREGERSAEYARRAGLPHREYRLLPTLGAAQFHGATRLPDLLEWIADMEAAGRTHPAHRATRANALACLGRFDDARRLIALARGEMADRAAVVPATIMATVAADIETAAGDDAAALALRRQAAEIFEAAGERGWLSTIVAALGDSHYRLGDLDQAEAEARRSLDLGATDDTITQMLARQVLAKVGARRGDFTRAEELAREAVALGDAAEMLTAQADAYADLAEVLRLAGKEDEAKTAIDEAIARYERKGHRVGARRARAFAGYDEALAGR